MSSTSSGRRTPLAELIRKLISYEKNPANSICSNVHFRVRIACMRLHSSTLGRDSPLCAHRLWWNINLQRQFDRHWLPLSLQRIDYQRTIIATTNVNYGVNFGQWKGYVLETKIRHLWCLQKLLKIRWWIYLVLMHCYRLASQINIQTWSPMCDIATLFVYFSYVIPTALLAPNSIKCSYLALLERLFLRTIPMFFELFLMSFGMIWTLIKKMGFGFDSQRGALLPHLPLASASKHCQGR